MDLEIDGLIVFAYIILLSLQIISFFSRRGDSMSFYTKLTDEIGQWAFGDGWRWVRLETLNDRWNERHSDIFFINGSDLIIESFDRIIDAYNKKENYGSQT